MPRSLTLPRLRKLVLSMTCALALPCALPAAGEAYDLPSLPAYRAEARHAGLLRIHGSQLTFPLLFRWKKGFFDLHRDIRYRENMLPSWFSGLCADSDDLVLMGHEAWRPDLMAFQECFGYEPLEILVATGGYDQNHRGNTPGVVILVHKDNPLQQLSMAQLDGILGAERSGGWDGLRWSTANARGAEGNVRTWGQLGLEGDWRRQPIRIYGTDVTQSLWAGTIQRVVFKGGTKWNPALHEMVRADHIRGAADVATVAAVAADRYSIGFQFMKVVKGNPGVKPLALEGENGEYVSPTLESFYRRSYPLVTGIYVYVNRPPGKALPARLKAFLTYVLSREGQQAIVDDGLYLPLTPAMAAEQRRKLD